MVAASIKDGSFKASETLLGIETKSNFSVELIKPRFKASETLLGIETKQSLRIDYDPIASKPLKPF